jgi:curved DNA-binding protein
MEYKDYYKILDMDKSADREEIEKAYRKLARRYHPDVNPDDNAAAEQFREINEAREVLMHPHAKEKYDRLSASWAVQQRAETTGEFDWRPWVSEQYKSEATPIDLNDILNQINQNGQERHHSDFFEVIFGGMAPAQDQGDSTPQRGQDYHHQVEISLEEAFAGATRVLRVNGRGLEVKIPRGAQSGTKVRVRGEGSDGVNGGPKGDLYLEIKVAPDPLFNRIGDDLHLELPVDVYSAVLGGEAIVPTLKGKIKLKIPPGTQSGRTFRIKGQGMPNIKSPDQRGDLYAKAMITVPENLTELEIELFEELADLRGL